jgi:hypothetical protein
MKDQPGESLQFDTIEVLTINRQDFLNLDNVEIESYREMDFGFISRYWT